MYFRHEVSSSCFQFLSDLTWAEIYTEIESKDSSDHVILVSVSESTEEQVGEPDNWYSGLFPSMRE